MSVRSFVLPFRFQCGLLTSHVLHRSITLDKFPLNGRQRTLLWNAIQSRKSSGAPLCFHCFLVLLLCDFPSIRRLLCFFLNMELPRPASSVTVPPSAVSGKCHIWFPRVPVRPASSVAIFWSLFLSVLLFFLPTTALPPAPPPPIIPPAGWCWFWLHSVC